MSSTSRIFKFEQFEKIAQMDDCSIQQVLRAVEPGDLILALKGSSDDVRNCIFKNMSTRAVEMLKTNLDATSPPPPMQSREKAQQRIVNTIRRLEEAEEIIVAAGD